MTFSTFWVSVPGSVKRFVSMSESTLDRKPPTANTASHAATTAHRNRRTNLVSLSMLFPLARWNAEVVAGKDRGCQVLLESSKVAREMAVVDGKRSRLSPAAEAWRLLFDYFLSLDPY